MIFPYSDIGKRYHTYDYYLKHTYGSKCAKIPLDGGFSCPNRERGVGGCIYCSSRGSGDFCSVLPSLTEQFRAEYERLSEKWGKRLPAIPYFQAYSGTYAPAEVLREKYEEVLRIKEVPMVSMSIATRPDCLPGDVLGYLEELNKRIPLTVELGLQSMHDATLLRIRRGHDLACFDDAFRNLRAAGIAVCVHIINGLPGEDEGMMLDTARHLADLRPEFLKIHMLHILSGTALAEEYGAGGMELISREDYIRVVCEQIALLPPEVVICRVTGDGAQDALIAPEWTKNKRAVLNGIDRYLAEHDLYQGCKAETEKNRSV